MIDKNLMVSFNFIKSVLTIESDKNLFSQKVSLKDIDNETLIGTINEEKQKQLLKLLVNNLMGE